MNAMVNSIIEIDRMFKAFSKGIGILKKLDQILTECKHFEQICKYYANSEVDSKKGRMTFYYLWAPLYIKIRLYRYITNNLPRYGVLLDWGFLDPKGKEIDPEFTIKYDENGGLCADSDKSKEILINLNDESTYEKLVDLIYKLLSTSVEDRTKE